MYVANKSVSPAEMQLCSAAVSLKSLIPFFMLPPGALTQAIRNFAKSLESWLTNAMMNIPEEMVRIKVLSFCISLQLVEQHVS